MEKMNMVDINNNVFATLLYNKPKNIIKERIYYFKEIRPLLKRIKKGPIPFNMMVEFSNFIKIIEIVWFYHNDIKYIKDIDDEIRIISDNQIGNNQKKNLTILVEGKATIIINMEHIIEVQGTDGKEMIYIDCRNEFGKKINTKFEITNAEITGGEINDNNYNLLYNINHLLQELMFKLFKTYYKKA